MRFLLSKDYIFGNIRFFVVNRLNIDLFNRQFAVRHFGSFLNFNLAKIVRSRMFAKCFYMSIRIGLHRRKKYDLPYKQKISPLIFLLD